MPPEITELTNLELLHLHSNDLSGIIPDADIKDLISDCGNGVRDVQSYVIIALK